MILTNLIIFFILFQNLNNSICKTLKKRLLHDHSVHFEEDNEIFMPNRIQFTTVSVPTQKSELFNSRQQHKENWKLKPMKTILAVDHHHHVSCPQLGWKQIMETAIKANDPQTSISQIQSKLSEHQRGTIFIVMCSLEAQKKQMAKILQLQPTSQKSCQVISDHIWCQAIGFQPVFNSTIQFGK